MSWPSGDAEAGSRREEVLRDAARLWGGERPKARDLLGAFLADPGLAAAILFRLASRLSRGGHPLLAALAGRLNLALHGCLVDTRAPIGPGFHLPHPTGGVVGQGVRSGRDLILFQNVTLGAKSWRGSDNPVLGDGVIVFPNSLVFGAIRVGDGARVGGGSVVFRDGAPGEKVAGAPAVPEARLRPPGGQEEP